MSRRNPAVDWYFEKDTPWKDAYRKLRAIMLDADLTEELKWGCPCYTLNGKNVTLIHGFKAYCALLFHKGALLKDENHILIQQTKSVQAARQIRFGSAHEVDRLSHLLSAYVEQAMQIERAGLKVPLKKTSEFKVPEEFAHRLNDSPALRESFEALTQGRQRAYLLYFSSAKQTETRDRRITNCIPRIMALKGLDDVRESRVAVPARRPRRS